MLLYCFHWDPKVGRYSATVMNLVRGGGVAAVAVLALFLTIMLRRDHRRDRAWTAAGRLQPREHSR